MPEIITNKWGLPVEIKKAAVENRHITNGDISVTTLSDSPYIRLLLRDNTVQNDCVFKMPALFGTAIHKLIENASIGDADAAKFKEVIDILKYYAHELGHDKADKVADWLEDFSKANFKVKDSDHIHTEFGITIEMGGWKISGHIDRFDEKKKLIRDYKCCKTFNYTDQDSRRKHDWQLNIYAYILEKMGYEVNKLEVQFIFTDWSFAKSKRTPIYPAVPVMSMPVRRYPNALIEEYMLKRIKMHKETMTGEKIHYCTSKDKWEKEDAYAVMAKGNKKASKLCLTREEAMNYIAINQPKNKKPLHIEYRPGKRGRCDVYCPASSVCDIKKFENERDEKLKKLNNDITKAELEGLQLKFKGDEK